MKLTKKILFGSLFSAAAAVTIISVPTVMCINKNQNNSISNSQTNVLTNKINSNDIENTNSDFGAKNIENQIKSSILKTNFQDMDISQVQKQINIQINKRTKLTSQQKEQLLKSSNEVLSKMKNGQLSKDYLINFIQSEFNKNSEAIIKQIKSSEAKSKILNQKMLSKNDSQQSFIANSTPVVGEMIYSKTMLTIADAFLTAGAIASTAIAVGEYASIIFIGSGFASTASAVLSWASVAVTTEQLIGISSNITNMIGLGLDDFTFTQVINDAPQIAADLPEIISAIQDWAGSMVKIVASFGATLIGVGADIWADGIDGATDVELIDLTADLPTLADISSFLGTVITLLPGV